MEIDWKKTKTRFKKLKTNEKYRKAMQDKTAKLWDPLHIPFEECAYTFLMSDRSRGKTNQILLLMMIAAWDYDKKIEYVRTTEDEIAPKTILSMFDVITRFDYISIITGGEYNTVRYDARQWRYARSEHGKITKVCEKPFMHMSCVRRYMDLKSGYNSNDSDLILYDEFIGKEQEQDFERYMQLQSTFFRMRGKCKAVFIANTVNKQAPFFYEFTIAEPLEKLGNGDNILVQNPLGTRFYVEILESDKSNTKIKINTEYYGFTNSKLASITGAETWTFKEYQKINSEIVKEYTAKNIYIYYHGHYYRCDIALSDGQSLPMIEVHRASRIYSDSIIFTLENGADPRYIYGLGYLRSHQRFWKLFSQNQFYFDSNETGDVIERYYTQARMKMR